MDQADSAPAKAELDFHDLFQTKRPGDVILQAGDDEAKCFYFRLALLAELSSFFANLPTPSSDDLIDGTPLIPLHGTTSDGLAIFLAAVRTTTLLRSDVLLSGTGFILPPTHILEAAAVAKVYDTPGVFRILLDCMHKHHSDSYYDFALWAIADHPGKIEVVVKSTLQPGARDITSVEPEVIAVVNAHAPQAWSRLQDLHLRHIQAPKEFRRRIARGEFRLPYTSHRYDGVSNVVCDGTPEEVAEAVRQRYLRADSVDDIHAVKRGNFGLTCERCQAESDERYDEVLDWLWEFAMTYYV